MTMPALPASGSTSWYAHYTALDTKARAARGGPWIVAASNAPQAQKDAANVLCDGTADEVEINAALTAHADVLLSDGTFNIAASISGAATTVSGKRLHGMGMGRTIIQLGASLVGGLSFAGTRTKIGTNPLAASVVKGAYTITTTTDLSATLPAGTLFVLRSTDVFNPKRGYYYRGEWARVRSVSGTTITLERQALDAYTAATAEIYKVEPVRDVEVSDMTFVASASTTTRHELATFQYGENCVFRNVEAKGKTAIHGLKMEMVVGAYWDHCRAVDIYDHNRNEIGGGFAEGYGMIAEGCERATMRSCYGLRNRHSFEDNAHTLHPVSRFLLFDDCTAERDYSAGFSSHGSSQYQSAINCTTISCGGGFVFRGSYTTLRNNRVIGMHADPDPTYYDAAHAHFNNATAYEGYDRPLWIGEVVQQGGTGTDFQGISGTGLVVDGFFADVTGFTRTLPSVTGRTGPVIESFEPMVDASIRNVSARGFTGDGILLKGQYNESVYIDDIELDCSSTFSASYPIKIVPTGATAGVAAGFRSQDIVIRRVRSKKAKNPVVYIAGGASTAAADVTERIQVEECVNLALGTTAKAILELPNGQYNLVEFFRNKAPDIAVASTIIKTGTTASSYKWMNKGSAAAVDATTPAAL